LPNASERSSTAATEPTITVVAAVIEAGEAVLITRRLRGTHLEGLWEFPGGKVQNGERHDEALRREIDEELAARIDVHELLLSTTHCYPHLVVVLHFYRCTLRNEPLAMLGQEMRWVNRSELPTLPFPAADEELIALLGRARNQRH
jgi:8-oxo-dGTP diphosphatase